MLHTVKPILTYSVYHNVPPEKLGITRLSSWDVGTAIEAVIKLKNAYDDKGFTHLFVKSFFANLSEGYRSKLAAAMNRFGPDVMLVSAVSTAKIVVDFVNSVNSGERELGQRRAGATDEILDIILEYNERQYRSTGIGTVPDSQEQIWELMMMQSPNGYNQRQYVRTGAAKQFLFLEFLKVEIGDRYPAFVKEVLAMTGAVEVRNLIILFLALLKQEEHNYSDNRPYIAIGPDNPAYELIHSLKLVTAIGPGEGPVTQAQLHMQPFLALSEKYILLLSTHDFSLITNQGWINFLFHRGLVQKFLSNIRNYSNWQSFLGKRFVENFLMGGMLKSLSRKGVRVIESDDKFFPDFAIVINEKEVLLLEVKSTSLHYNTWINENLTQFKVFLYENFCGGKKGVIQLNNAIRRMAGDTTNKYGFLRPLKEITIYPIIVYTEPHLSMAGVNTFILENSPKIDLQVKSHFKRIYPVTMMHDEFFMEHLAKMIEDRQFIPSMIKGFLSNRRDLLKKYARADTTTNYIKANRSFEDYAYQARGGYAEKPEFIIGDLVEAFSKISSELRSGREHRWQKE